MTIPAEPVTLEFSGAVANLLDRVNGLELGVRDLSVRFAAMEARFAAMEARFAALEARMDLQGEQIGRILSILTRLATRWEG